MKAQTTKYLIYGGIGLVILVAGYQHDKSC